MVGVGKILVFRISKTSQSNFITSANASSLRNCMHIYAIYKIIMVNLRMMYNLNYSVITDTLLLCIEISSSCQQDFAFWKKSGCGILLIVM